MDGEEASTAASGSTSTATPGTGSDSVTSSSASTDSSDSTGMPPVDDDAVFGEFYSRVLGLWTAPVESWTSVPNLPLMTMDVRPADGRTLFSRVDLDDGNALRFAFSREVHGGQEVLVYRNGGLFLGLERDSRTQLVEHDPTQETYRFCSIDSGCEYIDATFDFDGAERFDLDVVVREMMHIHWAPTRAEARPQETPFPADDDANPGDTPFPAMPTLKATMTWDEPLEAAAGVWIILSTRPCLGGGACTPSRFIHGRAEAGATELELTLVQIHPGNYKVNGILDRNDNLGGVLLPDMGDGVAAPDTDLTIAAMGETETTVHLFDL
jgi:hypothetical protein